MKLANLALLLLGSSVALASSTTSSNSTTTITSSSSSETTSMPEITTTASSSLSSSSYNVTFSAVVPTGFNPYVSHETLPGGLPFIVVFGFIGLIFLTLITARLVMCCTSRRAAKKAMENEKVDYNYDPSIFNELPQKSKTYSHSIYSLSSQSTLNVLGSTASMENLITQNQGRTYRSAVTRAQRGSLFISPTELLSMGGLNAPDMSQAGGYLSTNDSPVDSPTDTYFPGEYKKRPSRPPSVYMEKLLDDDLDDFDISSGDGPYDDYAHEKV